METITINLPVWLLVAIVLIAFISVSGRIINEYLYRKELRKDKGHDKDLAQYREHLEETEHKLQTLRTVLLDSNGKASITGSPEDNEIIARCLS